MGVLVCWACVFGMSGAAAGACHAAFTAGGRAGLAQVRVALPRRTQMKKPNPHDPQSESNSTVSNSMVSKLTSTATANDGLAVATSQLLSSTGIENLNAEVGGLGLVTAVNQGVFKADATSTTDDASALGINEASAGILDSTFTFGITDSTITAKDFNSLQVTATSTGSDAWSKLQSSSTGIADLSGIENRITDAGTISAIASDQGFAHSATVSGTSTAFASQEAIGMSGYEVSNHSDLTLSAQALVSSESNSSAVGV